VEYNHQSANRIGFSRAATKSEIEKREDENRREIKNKKLKGAA
jgi:hypothetical protein